MSSIPPTAKRSGRCLPALAAGCTIVVKPAEATPLCARAVFEIFESAGVPDGVANLVTALDPGPVAPIITYGDDDDILAMANDTSYGLASYVYTRDLKKAFSLFEGLRFGMVGINDINPTSAAAPFGGVKESGLGREGAMEGLDEYLDIKLGGFAI